MATKVSISKCKIRKEPFWRVRWHENGVVRRKFFGSQAAAETHASKVRGELVGARQLLASIPQHEQEQLVMVYNEAKRRGVDLLALLAAPAVATVASPALSVVLDEMELAKRKAGRDEGYLKSLRQIVDMFGAGQEKMPINKLTHLDVEKFLDSKLIASRSTLRARLSTLFCFAVRRGYRSDNPCDRLETQTPVAALPCVFTVEDTKKCLDWLRQNPRSLAWFVLSALAGLRPEEAEKTEWREINFTEGFIKVEAQTTKTRQRRIVYPLPVAMKWLKLAKKLKSQLPLTVKTRKADRDQLRALLEWPKWKQDITRHSAASYWLAHCGSAATVATALGHSEQIMRKNYMALVTKTEAAKFWALTP